MELPPHDLTGALASPFYGGPWAFVTARAGRTPVASAAVPQEAPAPGTPFYGRRPGWVPRFPQKSKKEANFPLAFSREPCYTKQSFRRYSSSVERKLPKLDRRVRLPLPAPKKKDIRSDVLLFWVPAAGGGLHPVDFKCSAQTRRGPEGPWGDPSVNQPKTRDLAPAIEKDICQADVLSHSFWVSSAQGLTFPGAHTGRSPPARPPGPPGPPP